VRLGHKAYSYKVKENLVLATLLTAFIDPVCPAVAKRGLVHILRKYTSDFIRIFLLHQISFFFQIIFPAGICMMILPGNINRSTKSLLNKNQRKIFH
jgi:hypothetical protein